MRASRCRSSHGARFQRRLCSGRSITRRRGRTRSGQSAARRRPGTRPASRSGPRSIGVDPCRSNQVVSTSPAATCRARRSRTPAAQAQSVALPHRGLADLGDQAVAPAPASRAPPEADHRLGKGQILLVEVPPGCSPRPADPSRFRQTRRDGSPLLRGSVDRTRKLYRNSAW